MPHAPSRSQRRPSGAGRRKNRRTVPTTSRTAPAPRSHGQSVGPPVSASVPVERDTPTGAELEDAEADAPFDVELPADALAGLVDGSPLVVLVLSTWNGAENRCGLVKSC